MRAGKYRQPRAWESLISIITKDTKEQRLFVATLNVAKLPNHSLIERTCLTAAAVHLDIDQKAPQAAQLEASIYKS